MHTLIENCKIVLAIMALIALGVMTFISVVIGIIIAMFTVIGAVVVLLVQDPVKRGDSGDN